MRIVVIFLCFSIPSTPAICETNGIDRYFLTLQERQDITIYNKTERLTGFVEATLEVNAPEWWRIRLNFVENFIPFTDPLYPSRYKLTDLISSTTIPIEIIDGEQPSIRPSINQVIIIDQELLVKHGSALYGTVLSNDELIVARHRFGTDDLVIAKYNASSDLVWLVELDLPPPEEDLIINAPRAPASVEIKERIMQNEFLIFFANAARSSLVQISIKDGSVVSESHLPQFDGPTVRGWIEEYRAKAALNSPTK